MAPPVLESARAVPLGLNGDGTLAESLLPLFLLFANTNDHSDCDFCARFLSVRTIFGCVLGIKIREI